MAITSCKLRRIALALITGAALLASSLEAQAPLRPAADPPPPPGSGPLTVVAGPEYAAGWFRNEMMGTGYRSLWTTPLVSPVLNLQHQAGGLRLLRVGGGFQTQTIHFRGKDDGYYLFRSVNKSVRNGLAPDVRDTPAGWLVQEVTSSMHPAGGWVVPPLLEAVGVPQSQPKLFLMPNDPALGEHRAAFAGVLGMLIESPDKGESGQKRFRGSDDIAGSVDMLEQIEANPTERVDERSLLASRLVDLVVGDPDRNFDNFRWIAYDSAQKRSWHPVPMDRDPAFLRSGGVIGWLVREIFIPKYVRFGPKYTDVAGLWVSQPEVDRLLLTELDWPTWDSTVAALQAAFTDAAIDSAVASMPPEYTAVGGDFLATSLRARRDNLREVAWRFYLNLAGEVDVQATSAADVAEVEHRGDGSLEVAMHSGCRAPRLVAQDNGEPIVCTTTYYRRRFDPVETSEVRVYLRAGDDRAIVRGSGPQRIRVRVLGGEGNDTLSDASTPDGSSRTVLYDFEGNNQLLGPHVDPRPWYGRVITDFISNESKDSTYQDFGRKKRWMPLAEIDPDAGVILGLHRRVTDYGFRLDPWGRQIDVGLRASLRGGLGGEVAVRRRLEGSDVVLAARAGVGWNVWSYRFYGYGNDQPLIDSDLALVPADEARLALEAELPVGALGTFTVGPAFRYLWPDPDPLGPLVEDDVLGEDDFGDVGVAGRLALESVDDVVFPRRGFEVLGEAGAYTPVQGDTDPFARAEGQVRGYLPLPLGSALALRVGGGVAGGDFPSQEAIYVGGRRSLRGFHTDRFAGDATTYGSAELRVPVGELTLLTRGRVGVLALADAGRVWLDGESPGGWHTSAGGGLWYSTMGLTGTLVVAAGEETRLHAYFGLPF